MSDPIQGAGTKIAEQTFTRQAESGSPGGEPAAGDVGRFQEAMNEPAPPGPPPAPGGDPAGGGLGDQILKSMQQLGDRREGEIQSVEKLVSSSGDQPMSIHDAMRLQFELMKMNQEQELTTKVADKSGQGVQTLLRNQ